MPGMTAEFAYPAEGPPHKVVITRPFYLSQDEIRWCEYDAVMGQSPQQLLAQGPAKLTWKEASTFCEVVSAKRGRQFRLPTEAEWEYAARGGGAKVKWAGTSNERAVGDYAWFRRNSGEQTQIVGKKEPNSLGLYDMSGNVWEWVEDWYDKDYYNKSPKNNPKGPSSGTSKVLRSGAWDSPVGNVRVADRHFSLPSKTDKSYGFRLVFSPP